MTIRSKTVCSVVAILLAGLAPAVCRAMAAAGDEVKISFKTADGATVDMQKLKGKLVVFDFWATWCGPCMQMMPQVVAMNQKYSSKGLVLIGISLDQDRARMQQVTKQQGMNWPEYFDGQGWGNMLFKQYGGTSIPFTMLIGTQGKVLFAGHPAEGLDRAIEEAFKKDPPQLVDPAVLAKARDALDGADKKISAGDARGAIRLLSKLPVAAMLDPEFASHAADVQKKMETAANAMLTEAQAQIDGGNYQEAASRLKEMSDGLNGMPAAKTAKKMLGELMAKPAARAAIAQAEKETKAGDALAVALKLQAQRKDEQAYPLFKDLAREFAGTDAAARADEQVKKYEADTAFIQRAMEHAAAGKAASAFRVAESYKRAGRTDLARKKYQSVIDEFPGTSYAATAKKAISELDPN